MGNEAKTYSIGNDIYTLHYSMGRLEQIEQVTGRAVMSVLVGISKQQMVPISLLKTYFAYGLINSGGVYAPLKTAIEFASQQLEALGYTTLMNRVVEQMLEDCGFLFQTD